MCIRDSVEAIVAGLQEADRDTFIERTREQVHQVVGRLHPCLLYTSDAADERSSGDLGGRRIIKKKTSTEEYFGQLRTDVTARTHDIY